MNTPPTRSKTISKMLPNLPMNMIQKIVVLNSMLKTPPKLKPKPEHMKGMYKMKNMGNTMKKMKF